MRIHEKQNGNTSKWSGKTIVKAASSSPTFSVGKINSIWKSRASLNKRALRPTAASWLRSSVRSHFQFDNRRCQKPHIQHTHTHTHIAASQLCRHLLLFVLTYYTPYANVEREKKLHRIYFGRVVSFPYTNTRHTLNTEVKSRQQINTESSHTLLY